MESDALAIDEHRLDLRARAAAARLRAEEPVAKMKPTKQTKGTTKRVGRFLLLSARRP